MSNKVIIIGSSGHCKSVIDIFEKENKYEIIGIIDNREKKGECILGYEIIGNDADLIELIQKSETIKLFIAVGDNYKRSLIVKKLLMNSCNIEFVSTIHPSSLIGKNVKIGKGVAIMPGTIINADSKIGDFSIINTKASIDHDCFIDNYCSVSPNVTLGGNVTLKEFSAVMMSSSISHNLVIGKNCIVGANSLILKDCDNNSLYYGYPAKRIRKRVIGEEYL